MSDPQTILDCARLESALSVTPCVLSQADIERLTGINPQRQVAVRRLLRDLGRLSITPTDHGFAYALIMGGDRS